jgi:hypothetical protein
MSTKFLMLRAKYGAGYGLIAGVGYAFFTWFLDAVGLATAHAAYPFVKLLGGLLITLPVFVLVGWLTAKSDSHFLGLVLWAILSLWAFTAAFLAQYDFIPRWYALMQQPVATLVKPSIPSYFMALLVTVGAILMMFAFLIAGLIEINLIESTLASSAVSAEFMSGIIIVMLMALAGNQVDTFIYSNSRLSMQAFQKLITLVASPEGQALAEKTKNLRNFGAVTSLGLENLKKPHRFFLIKDMTGDYGTVDLMIEFGDSWGKCIASNRDASYCAPTYFKYQAPSYYI